MQQDAHEFLNFLINHINEIILAERNQGKSKTTLNGSGVTVNENISTTSGSASSDPTWVHEIFQGVLTSETRCLNCETISSKDENFFDLQVDVDQVRFKLFPELQSFQFFLSEHVNYALPAMLQQH